MEENRIRPDTVRKNRRRQSNSCVRIWHQKEERKPYVRVKADLSARSGIIDRQSDNGVELPGRSHQYGLIDYLGKNWKNYLESIGDAKGVKLK
jgi:hypothetical protein